jgi:hypothetical protein
MDLVNPLVSFLGVESGDPIGHKRFLALFAGGMLPLISLSFLHMLVKFEEEEKKKQVEIKPVVDIDALSIEAGKMEAELEKEVWIPTEEDLNKLEDILLNKETKVESSNIPQKASEMMVTTDEDIIDSIPSDDEISDWDITLMDGLEDENYEDTNTENEELKINRLSYLKRDV